MCVSWWFIISCSLAAAQAVRVCQSSASREVFNALKKEGMGLAISKKYKEAKIKLTQASDMKSDAEVTAKISEIDKILKDNEDKASVDEGYKKIVAEASALE